MSAAPAIASPEVLTYLTDAAEPAPGQFGPRVGDRSNCASGAASGRSRSGRRAFASGGFPAERAALDGLLPQGGSALRGHISALVPRPLRIGSGRIHIRVSAGLDGLGGAI